MVALKPEAGPVVERFRMSPADETGGPFRVWKSAAGDHWLVVSGVGKALAAAATAWLYARSLEPKSAVWINAGIAGHREWEPGTVRRIEKITDGATGRHFLLTHGPEGGMDPANLISSDRPIDEYPTDGSLVDMEAAGFCAMARRIAGQGRVHVVKVVSDNLENDHRTLTPGRVRELMMALIKRSGGLVDILQGAPQGRDRTDC